ncbi:hypothetical protein, partial [Methylotenera sp.]|uniref:hypothetical protein n=1 Tax=Methylotenera sp. TaxID=2051956 RepID=UPI002720B3A4
SLTSNRVKVLSDFIGQNIAKTIRKITLNTIAKKNDLRLCILPPEKHIRHKFHMICIQNSLPLSRLKFIITEL